MRKIACGFAAVSILALGALGLISRDSSALTLPVTKQGMQTQLPGGVDNLQLVGSPRERYLRDRSLRYRDNRYRYRYWPRYRHWPNRNRFYYGPYWAGDPWLYDDPPIILAPTVRYNRSAHVEWCLARYRSYNPETNTWIGYSGRVYQCDSPYDRR